MLGEAARAISVGEHHEVLPLFGRETLALRGDRRVVGNGPVAGEDAAAERRVRREVGVVLAVTVEEAGSDPLVEAAHQVEQFLIVLRAKPDTLIRNVHQVFHDMVDQIRRW